LRISEKGARLTQQHRYAEVDALRGIAAMSVLKQCRIEPGIAADRSKLMGRIPA
jgi:hypothetical protein